MNHGSVYLKFALFWMCAGNSFNVTWVFYSECVCLFLYVQSLRNAKLKSHCNKIFSNSTRWNCYSFPKWLFIILWAVSLIEDAVCLYFYVYLLHSNKKIVDWVFLYLVLFHFLFKYKLDLTIVLFSIYFHLIVSLKHWTYFFCCFVYSCFFFN